MDPVLGVSGGLVVGVLDGVLVDGVLAGVLVAGVVAGLLVFSAMSSKRSCFGLMLWQTRSYISIFPNFA